ncbi:hypothetical protein KP509_07G041900 [Ceratopteris richardii]|uniref:Pentatricopeptide repeat-containing protein n=1 Tax=Ceratopteris richardii TaxID=49495 RepID=A0A8T2UHK9_CERRI|nr:hypothetical protein KP509_07G041900 [Ceratopteris richardii]
MCVEPGNDVLSLVASLKICAISKDLLAGNRIYVDSVRKGLLSKNTSLGNTFISMYSKCGAFDKAQEVFDELPNRTVVSWNALITGYAHCGEGIKALKCFKQMQLMGFLPDEVTFVCILKACGSLQALAKGQEIHVQILRERLFEKHVAVANGLLDMYMKCGSLKKAQEVFNELPVHDTVTWNTLIAGYAHSGHGEEALHHLELMQLAGYTPNAVTFICALNACGSIGALEIGEGIHAQVLQKHLLEDHMAVANALVDMYAKCSALEKAQVVFDELQVRDIVCWNALIAGYSQHEQGEIALNCFEQMQHESQFPNAITLACALNACGTIGALGKGRQLHAHIVKERFLEKDHVIGNALVDMYAKCGDIGKAEEVFDELSVHEIVSWTALIGGYVELGLAEKAFHCFERMQSGGIFPNAVTFACILKACGAIGMAFKGREIHNQIVKEHALEQNVMVGTALIYMYTACGMLLEAQRVFDKLPIQDAVLWDVLMEGYAQHGEENIVLRLFDKMMEQNMEPNLFTFTTVLNTCSRKGLVDEAQKYFRLIGKGYGLNPGLEHHTCMVDIFGQIGCLDRAIQLIKEMPFAADLRILLTLLCACQKWGDLKIGRWAFEQAKCLNENDAAAYVIMSSIYSEAGRHGDASEIEDMRVRNRAWKSDHYFLSIKDN